MRRENDVEAVIYVSDGPGILGDGGEVSGGFGHRGYEERCLRLGN